MQKKPTLVVGVGASAGGLPAFRELLEALPSDSGMTFLLVQHLDPQHESMLTELLRPHTQMPVHDAEDGAELRPDTVFVIKPGTALGVEDNRIVLSKPELHNGVRLPVDHLFCTLARSCADRAVGIILSGAGSDGSSGLREIKAAGGLTVVQAPDTSIQPGMPESAIASDVVDVVQSISEMPATLLRFAELPLSARREPSLSGPDGIDQPPPPSVRLPDERFYELARLLEPRIPFDLNVYKRPTVARRLQRRMILSGCETPDDYMALLRDSPEEQSKLIRDLLISVTEFFRDPEAFAALRKSVIDPIVEAAAPGTTLRAWVPGCATGEEAYSVAMEFLEAIDASEKAVSLRVFGTDVDQKALSAARAAIYSHSIAERVPQPRLDRYFTKLDGRGYKAGPLLRDTLSFAAHDITKDPPFSRMHLVSCRNVLIYLQRDAQAGVLRTLHFALRSDGYLMLGTSESTVAQRELFVTVSKSQHIYRKVGTSPALRPGRSLRTSRGGSPDEPIAFDDPANGRSASDLARKVVLSALAPPSLVVAEDGSIVFTHGELTPFLRIPEGEQPRWDLTSLLRPEIAARVRGVLYRCRREQEKVEAQGPITEDSSAGTLIAARPVPRLGLGAVLLTFEQPAARPLLVDANAGGSDEVEASIIAELEKELEATREDLRNTAEELETSNEELRTSNEESMSMNEELQSANEELEATTEELRSLNEELTTVNAQLREKVEQLQKSNDDLTNFLSSSNVATLFLNGDLEIVRVTPAARELLSIGESDIGRRVGDVARQLLQDGLAEDANSVLSQQGPQTRELETSDGRFVVRAVLPYRTQTRRIEGVVVTFSDITELRSATEELRQKSARLDAALRAARGAVFEQNLVTGRVTFYGDQWARLLGEEPSSLPLVERFGAWLAERVAAEDQDRFSTLMDATHFDGAGPPPRSELRMKHRDGSWIWVQALSEVSSRTPEGHPREIITLMVDITGLKNVEAALRESEARFRIMADGLPLIVWVHNAEAQLISVNATFREFFGLPDEELPVDQWTELLHPDDRKGYVDNFEACLRDGRPFHAEARTRHADGTWRWIESWGRPRLSHDGRRLGMVGSSADITDRKQVEHELEESELRFRSMADNISPLAWMADGTGHVFWYNKRWYEYTGSTFEDVEGLRWKAYHHPDHLDRVVERFSGCLETGEPWEDTFPLRSADGKYRWFLSRALPIRDDAGRILRWFGTNTDVTDQRRLEVDLKESSRQKDHFLAMLGHELRNPIAAIKGAADLLEGDEVDEALVHKSRSVLNRQTRHMARLLDQLLETSRIVTGKIRLLRTRVDLTQIVRNVADDALHRPENRNRTISLDLPDGPVFVIGDSVRLTQIFDNLLSNATKYTRGGGRIWLRLGAQDEFAHFEIADDGMGIDPELLPRVFDVFQQASQDLDRGEGGLGLGLALVKSLTELHGGEVEAFSPGRLRGARFELRLPIVATETEESKPRRPEARDPLDIVLVEDNEDAAELLKLNLERRGHRVRIATDGAAGVEAARDARPDVVLCDLGLPGPRSGFDVARELRAETWSERVALIAISGYGAAEDKQRAREAGFDEHLTKPVDMDQLESIMAATTKRRR